MSNIRIRNGVLLASENNYLIYKMYIPGNISDRSMYFMCIPNSAYKEYQMIVDLPEIKLLNLDNSKLADEIKKNTDKIFNKYKNIIYVLPNVDLDEKHDALSDNDNHLFTKFHEKIMYFVSSAYWSVKSQNQDIIIPETTNIVLETELDKRYIDWLQLNRSSNNFIAINLNDNPPIDDNAGESLSGDAISNELDYDVNKPLIKKLVPHKKNSSGFTNAIYLSNLLLLILLGIIIGYLIIK